MGFPEDLVFPGAVSPGFQEGLVFPGVVSPGFPVFLECLDLVVFPDSPESAVFRVQGSLGSADFPVSRGLADFPVSRGLAVFPEDLDSPVQG